MTNWPNFCFTYTVLLLREHATAEGGFKVSHASSVGTELTDIEQYHTCIDFISAHSTPYEIFFSMRGLPHPVANN